MELVFESSYPAYICITSYGYLQRSAMVARFQPVLLKVLSGQLLRHLLVQRRQLLLAADSSI
jgi:hypothetical protein